MERSLTLECVVERQWRRYIFKVLILYHRQLLLYFFGLLKLAHLEKVRSFDELLHHLVVVE